MDSAVLRLLQNDAPPGPEVLPQVRKQDTEAGQRHTQRRRVPADTHLHQAEIYKVPYSLIFFPNHILF